MEFNLLFLSLPNSESVAYEFGAGRGLIQYQFPTGNQPDTEEDNIALGFVTMKADAVLLRIESSNTQDYFELEIVRLFPKYEDSCVLADAWTLISNESSQFKF